MNFDTTATTPVSHFDIAGLKIVQHRFILQQKARFPERMTKPAAFQLVDKHAEFNLGNRNSLEHRGTGRLDWMPTN